LKEIEGNVSDISSSISDIRQSNSNFVREVAVSSVVDALVNDVVACGRLKATENVRFVLL
jgi:hypothetical protein